jgi:coenzyme F420-reducing hydrogenase alpha subunit
VYTPRCTRVVHLKVLFANMITATNNNNNTNISFIHLCN